MSRTSNYNLEKPTVGSVGWGANVNTNFDTIDAQLKLNADEIDTKINSSTLDVDGTLAANSDSNIATQKATKTYADTKVAKTRKVNNKALTADITLGLASADFANQGTTTTVLHGNASGNPAFGAVVEADITLADNTTNDASTSKHGFIKKLSNVSTEFMNGQGAWAVPTGSFYILYVGRDMTAVSGDVSYTGIGFTPKALIAFYGVSGATLNYQGFGMATPSGANPSVYMSNQTTVGLYTMTNTSFIALQESSTQQQAAIVKTWDADGFTLTWTKTGSPFAGSGVLNIMCIR